MINFGIREKSFDLENIYCFVRKEEIQDALTNKKSLLSKIRIILFLYDGVTFLSFRTISFLKFLIL